MRGLEVRADLSSSEDWEFLIQLYEKAPFRHVPAIGSNWHIRQDEASRNKVGRKTRARNCKTIYALHPSPDEAVRQGRIARLGEMGVSELDDIA